MKLPVSRTRGASLVEYGLLTGLVSVVAIASVTALGGGVSNIFDETTTKLADTGVTGPGDAGPGEGDAGGEPAAPADPYAGYYDPDTFLIGTSAKDTLNIAFTSYLGIMALEDDDRLDAGSSGGILIGHKGNDTIITTTGDDTIVFAAGDGQDSVRTGGGNDKLVFPNLNAADATFHARGPHVDISWASGDKVSIDEMFWRRDYGFELFQFADRDFTFEEAVIRTQEDDKSTGTVYMTAGPDTLTHRASQDPNYTLTGYRDGPDSLHFAETNFADVRITRPGQSHIIVHDGGEVYIMEYLFNRGWLENISFKDGPRTIEEIWQRSLEDSQAGDNVHMSRHDDYFEHKNGAGSYMVTGSYTGADEINFVDLSSGQVSFGRLYDHLIIWTPAGDEVMISSYLSSGSARGWLETIRFTDGVLDPDQFQTRIDNGG